MDGRQNLGRPPASAARVRPSCIRGDNRPNAADDADRLIDLVANRSLDPFGGFVDAIHRARDCVIHPFGLLTDASRHRLHVGEDRIHLLAQRSDLPRLEILDQLSSRGGTP